MVASPSAAPTAANPVEGGQRRNTAALTARLAAAVAEAEDLEAQGRYREAAELTALAMAEVIHSAAALLRSKVASGLYGCRPSSSRTPLHDALCHVHQQAHSQYVQGHRELRTPLLQLCSYHRPRPGVPAPFPRERRFHLIT